ncbi:MAG: ATP-binding protein [Methanosphaera stadtmanae]|nr:ATP-binding protein [Methanosphaera stadtmanae]
MEKEEEILNFINNEITNIPITINNKIMRKNKKFEYREEFYEIKGYIDDFLEGENNNRYILLPGLRGVGKTTIIYQLYNYLLKDKNIKQNQILYLSCEKLNERFEFKILDVIDTFLKYHHNSTLRTLNKEIFLFIDESQYDYNWALSGKIIYDESNKIFMIFTGSSALNLEYNADSARRLLKRNITPLNYKQYLKLKYNYDSGNITDSLIKLIFNGDSSDAIKSENKINSSLYNITGYNDNQWDNYLMYGGFPISFYEKDYMNIIERLDAVIKKVIVSDMHKIGNISVDSQVNSIRLLNYLALQKPGEISQNNIANYLNTSSSTIKNILDILEKTHLLFHCEAYGSSSKRSKKSWKYYFATPSLRHALVSNLGNTMKDPMAYKEILLENLVATNFFNLTNKRNINFNMFYDDNQKRNVDFVIQQEFNQPIPIEVGIGKKDNKQVKNAIKRYKSEYGIIISNKTTKIKKEDNIISIPIKTFSFL